MTEESVLRRYVVVQREVCQAAGASFEPPDPDALVALAPVLLDGHRAVRGRRVGWPDVEWLILADDQVAPPPDQLSIQHVRHLATLREDLLLYLALPRGWSFAVLGDEARTWAAFSPKDQLNAYLRAWDAGERTKGDIVPMIEILDDSFQDLACARALSAALTELRSRSTEDRAAIANLTQLVHEVSRDIRER